jgi:hypothetical protein
LAERETRAAEEAAALLDCDVSWLPRFIAVLQRDFPQQLWTAMGTAISENAVEQVAVRHR